jgi:long-chain acyl-CoA synthetase
VGETLQTLVTGLAARGEAPAILAVDAAGRVTAWSYAELSRRALAFARGLAACGIGRGDPVAILSPNRPEWIVVRLGLLAAGALAVPLDDLSTDTEIARALDDSAARMVLTLESMAPRLAAMAGAGGRRVVLLDVPESDPRGWHAIAQHGESSGALPALDARDAVSLFYTSGTTGAPKGVPLTHANLLANLATLAGGGFVGPGDRVMLPLPLHHSYPFLVGMLMPLATGATIVIPPGITGPEIVLALKAGRATALVGVPRLFDALVAGIRGRVAAKGSMAQRLFGCVLSLSTALARRFRWRVGKALFGTLHRQMAPDLRLLGCGGARLEPETEWALVGLGWQVLTGYGLVETTSIATFNPLGKARVGSAGKPGPGVEVRIEAPDDEGRGEVLIRGATVFGGYRDNDAATRAAFTADGWFRSGDLGFFDDDGYLFIAGRAKEVIVLADGKNVTPDVVEAVYAASRYVRELAVLEHKGHLAALVVPNMESLARAGTTNADQAIRTALASAAQTLPSFQRLSGYAILRDGLPKTRLGKFKRHALPALYEAALKGARREPLAPSAADKALLERPRARAVADWLRARYPDAALVPDTALQLDLGIDSLAWVELGMEVERQFGVRLSEVAVARVATLRDLIRELELASPAAEAAAIDPAAILGARRFVHRAVGLFLYGLVAVLFRCAFPMRVLGHSRIPTRGPVLVAPNHLSDIDGFLVAAALGYGTMARTWFGADALRLFGSATMRFLSRAGRIFPIDDRAAGVSIAIGRAVLARGETLVWFPEGWRSPDGTVQRFLPGIIEVLRAAPETQVVPTRIFGTFEVLSRDSAWPRFVPVRVVFGEPVKAASLFVGTDTAGAAERLRRAVDALG